MTSLAPLMQYVVKPVNFKFVNEGDKSSFSNFRPVLHYPSYRETETWSVIIAWNEYLLQRNLCNHHTVIHYLLLKYVLHVLFSLLLRLLHGFVQALNSTYTWRKLRSYSECALGCLCLPTIKLPRFFRIPPTLLFMITSANPRTAFFSLKITTSQAHKIMDLRSWWTARAVGCSCPRLCPTWWRLEVFRNCTVYTFPVT